MLPLIMVEPLCKVLEYLNKPLPSLTTKRGGIHKKAAIWIFIRHYIKKCILLLIVLALLYSIFNISAGKSTLDRDVWMAEFIFTLL